MPDWSKKFKAEYDYARDWFGDTSAFDKDWRSLARKLGKLMGDDGFDSSAALSLWQLRRQVKQGEKKGRVGHKTVTEDHGILNAVGAWADDAGGVLGDNAKMRAAALKLLRHVYLLNWWGSKKVWVVSLPKEFTDWPSDHMHAKAGTQIAARVILRSDDEIFTEEQKKHLAHSTREALAWCHKTSMLLAMAAKASNKGSKKEVDALNVVKRWFADPAASIEDVNRYIGELSRGFKNIIAALNKGTFILTDWVPLRGASTQAEIDFLNSEAFTFASRGEGLDVVYIERSFFGHPGDVVKGQKNWTRVIVHELTHLVCGTTDVQNGNARYAWYGIGPHAGYPGSQAIRNADNWAFFSADCAGVLTESERNTALTII